MKYIIVSILIYLTACTHKKADTPYMYIKAQVLYDSIITRLPGSFYVKDSIFIWQDVFATDSFLHIVNLRKKSEVSRYGKIGKGPKEFTTPNVGSCWDNGLILYDQNGTLQNYFQIRTFLKGADPYKPLATSINRFCTDVIGTGDGELVSLYPDETSFLVFETKENSYKFGNTPFNKDYTNGYEINQGSLAYNKENEVLVYAMSAYPYFAIYKKSKNEFTLFKESSGDLHYNFSNNKILIEPSKRGIFSIALTKDFIIAHQRNYSKDNIDERTVGIDLSKVPSTLFVYTYEGVLVKIIDIKMPIIRLNSIYNEDVLYAIAANPDYTLVSIDVNNIDSL